MGSRAPTWEATYCEFFVSRERPFMRTAYAILGSWAQAEDETQQTFSTLYVYWPRIRDGGHDAYARRVLVNRCLSNLRKRRHETLTDEVPDQPVTEVTDLADSLDLRRAMQALKPRDRVLITLRYLDDLPVAAVAEILRVPEGTVKSQTSRAVARLRRDLGHELGQPADLKEKS
ncbi:SigE family RNA polymerase sigma factor [Nocardioides speluncae]|uniref:SigE family RNA polymerase sigma factor n=1 Tax=Nocardioides speluncae TaxID=2670337 RepID=UPI000D69C2D3|nr:SigE family RNA polymerase sigma factor [Nocardioides speluncae]